MSDKLFNALGIALVLLFLAGMVYSMATIGQVKLIELSCVDNPFQTKCPVAKPADGDGQ